MSKIPRPSPRPIRELPITDDEKNTVLPKILKKAVVKPKEENKNTQKQVKKTAITNAVLPSTSKGFRVPSNATQDRPCKTLNRSKTVPAMKLDHVSIQSKGRVTTSQAKQAANLQPTVNAAKKDEVPKEAARLKQRLSFRDKKPTKIEKPKREQPVSDSKIKLKTGKVDNIALSLKTKTAGPSKLAFDQPPKVPHKKPLNRSKTESAIKCDNLNKKSDVPKKIQEVNKARKGNDKQVKSTTLNKRDEMLLEQKDNKDGDKSQVKFISPREVPHSGLKFPGKPRKKSMLGNFNFNLHNPSQTSNTDCDSSAPLPTDETPKI